MGKMFFGYSWSLTRSAMYAQCRREFFYHYLHADEPFAEKAKQLRTLSYPYVATGQIVDDAVNMALTSLKETGEMIDNLASRAAHAIKKVIQNSERFAADMRANQPLPKNAVVLHEHYYGYELDSGLYDNLANRVQTCLANFDNSEILAEIAGVPSEDWSPIRLSKSNIMPPSFQLTPDVRVWAAVDFYFKKGGKLWIVDWKSGSPSEAAVAKAGEQLAVYSLYGHKGLGFSLDSISVAPIWLQIGVSWAPRPASEPDVNAVVDRIAREAAEHRALLAHAGTWKNEPVLQGRISDFPAEPDAGKCFRCRFREICPEGRNAIPSVPPPAVSEEGEGVSD